jgi:hypothetical protein
MGSCAYMITSQSMADKIMSRFEAICSHFPTLRFDKCVDNIQDGLEGGIVALYVHLKNMLKRRGTVT